jgi:hypothetical protein
MYLIPQNVKRHRWLCIRNEIKKMNIIICDKITFEVWGEGSEKEQSVNIPVKFLPRWSSFLLSYN